MVLMHAVCFAMSVRRGRVAADVLSRGAPFMGEGRRHRCVSFRMRCQ